MNDDRPHRSHELSRSDELWMRRAIEVAATARLRTAPNPWVGAVLVCVDGRAFEGATEPPGHRHAERVAIDAAATAGADTTGATIYTTLEPCSHHGRTPPCAEALVSAGVRRLVFSIGDPDPQVAGTGHAMVEAAGIEVDHGICADAVTDQLHPYLHHRRTGRPYVVLKLAATLDGHTAAADGTSQWITGPEARAEVHRLRAESGAVIVGAGTVRIDNPSLTVRHVDGPDPRRIVLGHAPPGAKVHPCLEWTGTVLDLLDELGADGVLQVLVEGGATVAASFHRAGIVDRYVVHFAPAFMGGDDGPAMLAGLGTTTIGKLQRGRIVSMRLLGDDLEIQLVPSEKP